MPTDIKLDDDTIHLLGAFVKTAGKLLIDHPLRRIKKGGLRRALLHDEGDKLTINFAGDYPAGVKVEGPHLMVEQLRVANPKAKEDKASPGGRALVQDEQDTLVINQGGFYTGGVRVEGNTLGVAKDIALLNGRLLVPEPAGGPFPIADLVKLVFDLRSQVEALQKKVKDLEVKTKGK